MEHRVALVTDSTAYLPADLVASRHVLVVPVQVVVGGRPFDEGTEITPAEVAEALRAWSVVTTSRPSPERFAKAYVAAAEAGATAPPRAAPCSTSTRSTTSGAAVASVPRRLWSARRSR